MVKIEEHSLHGILIRHYAAGVDQNEEAKSIVNHVWRSKAEEIHVLSDRHGETPFVYIK